MLATFFFQINPNNKKAKTSHEVEEGIVDNVDFARARILLSLKSSVDFFSLNNDTF